jgi:putative nucleotidyltransferase with HDIG domain
MLDGSAVSARIAALAAGGWALTSLLWASDALRRRSAMHTLHRRTVELLLNALSAEDTETERHSRRVADLSYALAQSAGLRGRALRTLRVAALLHDMGKIDDRFFDIVHSRRRLTREQQAEIRHHPHQSAHILEPLEGEHPGLRAIVCGHHERWDGAGYPGGLRGEQIPLGARIIAVADAFDAMTQSRPYRDAMEPARAIEELRSDAGAQFDPWLVDLAGSPPVRDAWEAVVRRPLVRSGERNGPRGRER